MTVSEDVPARPSRRVARVLDALRYMVALLVLCFAVVTFDAGSAKWGVLTLAIGVAVFCSQLVAVTAIRLVGLWFGVFYVLQALATPLLPDPDFVTLEPNYVREFEVVGGLPGISGVHRVTTDHQGFRTTRPVDYDSPAPLRIFMIGGSTIEQILLDDRKTSPHLLQEMLQEELGIEVEVVNTGVSGLRAVHHLATLRAIKDYHPDLVLFMLGVNDWNWHISFDLLDPQPPHRFEDLRLRNTPLGRTLQSAYLALKGPSADGEQAASPGAGPEIERGAYYDGKQNSLARDIKIQFLPDRVSDSFAETLGLIMSECKTLGIDCIFATQPNGYQEGASQAYKES